MLRSSSVSPSPARAGRRLLAVLLAGCLTVLAAGPGLARQATPVPAATPDPSVLAVEAAVAWLVEQQGEDGGFAGLGEGSDPGTTADVVVALKAAEFRGVAVEPALGDAVAYLEDQAAGYAAAGPGQAAKLTQAAVAAGRDPAAFGGVDLLNALAGGGTATPAATPVLPGLLGDDLYDHALVVIALVAAGEPVPAAAIEPVRAAQGEDGGWAFDGSTEPGAADSNTTAVVIQALVASGNGDDPMVESGLEYLRSVQTVLGQFAFQIADPLVADANSTALAVQAIVAGGGDPGPAGDWGNAARGLAAFQNTSGAFRYQDTMPQDNLLATLQAIPALAGLPLPVGVACPVEAPDAAVDGTPAVIALPAPAAGQTACVAIDEAA